MTIEKFIESYSPLKASGELKWNNVDIKEIAEQYAEQKIIEALSNAPLLKDNSKRCSRTGSYKH